MQVNVDPGFDADMELAQRALKRGWVTRERIESAILAQERTPGSRLLNHLPLTPDQLQKLMAPEGQMPPEIAAVAQEPSRRLDHYILGDFLHSGGMGRVHKAWDLKLSRWVALKCLKAVGDERSEAYFDREARLAAGLSHPNIAAIYESGRAGGESFIAMQLIPGKTLDKWGRRDVPRLVSWVRDAARAVAYANSKGIVHRDLKPTNVMVTPEGQVFVLDFGLARPVAVKASHSATGKAMGTPAYMSPEQARGGPVDARSDVYSLGATLFECLTGRAPFSGTTIYDVLRKVEETAPARPRRLNPRIAPDLETIILKCLEKEASRRYRSADELADDLDRYLNHDPIQARPAGVFYRMRRTVAKRKAIALASVVTVVLAGVLGWWFAIGRPHSEQLTVGTEHMRRRESAMKLWAEARGLAMAGVDPDGIKRRAKVAREAFERAIEVKEDAQSLVMKSWCLQLEARNDDALKALERAHELDPNHPEARLELAKAILAKYQALRGVPRDSTISGEKSPHMRSRLHDLEPESPQQRQLRERGERLLVGGAASPPHSNLLNAMLAMGKGEYERAASEWALYGHGESWDSRAMELEGVCQYFAGKPRKAVEAFDRSLRRAANAGVMWWRGEAKKADGLYDEAIADYTKAIESNPKFPNAYAGRGLAYIQLGRVDEAIGDFTKAFELNPRGAHIASSLATAKCEKGQFEEAFSDFTKAIQLDPLYSSAYSNRGNVHKKLGRLPEAISDYRKCLELDRKDWGAWFNLGLAHSAQASGDEAIADFTRVIELNPKHAKAFAARANENMAAKRHEAALVDYTTALELDPTDPEVWNRRAYVNSQLQRHAEAEADLRKCLEVSPPDWPHRSNIQGQIGGFEAVRLFHEAERLYQLNRYSESVEAFKEVFEKYPRSNAAMPAAYNAASGCGRLGLKGEALEWLEKAIDMGWTDVVKIEKNSDFDSLRQEEAYKRLLARLKHE